MSYHFFFPACVNYYRLKFNKYYLLLTFNSRYFWMPLSDNFLISYSKEFNVLSIKSEKTFALKGMYLWLVNYFIFSWVSLVSKKIKFKHKGAWIIVLNSNIRLLNLNFRLAHTSYLFNQRAFIRRRKKHFSFHTLLCLGYSIQGLLKMSVSIYNFFKINKFTFRGIRFSRHRLIKKEGKISKYMIDLKK